MTRAPIPLKPVTATVGVATVYVQPHLRREISELLLDRAIAIEAAASERLKVRTKVARQRAQEDLRAAAEYRLMADQCRP